MHEFVHSFVNYLTHYMLNFIRYSVKQPRRIRQALPALALFRLAGDDSPSTTPPCNFKHFFPNVTNVGPRTRGIIESDLLRPYCSVSFAEHHFHSNRLDSGVDRLGSHRINVSGPRARYTERSQGGTSGGVVSMTR